MDRHQSTTDTTTSSPSVFIFGWPSNLGGADTKLAHLLILLHQCCQITVVPNRDEQLKQTFWTSFMSRYGIRYMPFSDLPVRASGTALAMSNTAFFTKRIAHRAKEKGLRIAWSSEMMWHHPGELEAIQHGIVDIVLYTSQLQKDTLSPNYQNLPSAITGNYIAPELFPFKRKQPSEFQIGRLSRPDPKKYPEDFPVFYECLDLPKTRFRVMAWNEKLWRKYRWHHFDSRWDLLGPEEEPTVDFLHSLNLFIYPLGHRFTESWGRSTVEAMLTGSIPLVPPGHHLENLIEHGESGFICRDFQDYQKNAHKLYFDTQLRTQMEKNCRRHAIQKLCNTADHQKQWLHVFSSP